MVAKKSGPATRADVARLAGVSASTVTYAISGERSISDETRDRVLDAMAKLDYTPNVMAQGLAGRRSGLVALSFPIGERGFNASDFDYVHAAIETLEKQGYQLLLWPNATEDTDALRKIISQSLIEGVILMEVRNQDPRVEVLKQARIPFVLIGRTEDERTLTWADADFATWGPMAIEHLAALGHKHIGVIGQSPEFYGFGYGPVVRTEGELLRSADEHDVRVDIHRVDAHLRDGRIAVERMLEKAERPTALLGFNEPAMIGALEAISAAGLSVPGDMSILHFGISAESAEATVPAQTTVGVDGTALAEKATSFLLHRMQGGASAPEHFLAPAVFVDRHSTGPAPTK